MDFNWEKFIIFSEELINNYSSEEAFRSIISRSYYSAFNVSKNFLADVYSDFYKDQKDIHNKVIEKLKNASSVKDKSLRIAGRSLERLKKKRVRADYKDNVEIKKKDAELSILEGNSIINDIKEWSSPY